ncbi:metal-dependent hydrolase [Pyrococcus yayanosii]|uniref:metal-dependent hydrolase n=1 Tax=Pyrococcus yayanosii TaxID=1008460 RepID=UPI00064EAF92|nr:metal-dependent hydrolase [Pyrococcus yayanosii]
MNYEEHVLAGIITYPIAVFLATFLSSYIPLELSVRALIFGYAFYVLGSDLPDIDHPDSLIHRGSKPLISVAAGSLVFLRVSGLFDLEEPWLDIVVSWGISALVALASWYAFTAFMPRHRGVVHSLFFATFYAGVAFLMVSHGFGMSMEEGLFIAFVSFLGYALHLLLDGSIKLL